LVRVLFRRLVEKGIPVLWAAVAHRDTTPHVKISEPWCAYLDQAGQLQLLRGLQGKPQKITDLDQVAIAFSENFVV
jgi:hypothetical protein